MATPNESIGSSIKGAAAWSPDRTAFTPTDAIPEALILNATTVVDTKAGTDRGSILVPWVDDSPAAFSDEAAYLNLQEPALSQTLIHTHKITQMIFLSSELYRENGGVNAQLMSDSSMRAVTKEANNALMSHTPSERVPLTGLANTPGIIDGGNVTDKLDPIADVIAQIESNGGTAGIVVAHPLAWGKLRNLKSGKDLNSSLLGAGTEDMGKSLFGVPVVTSPAVAEDELIVIDPSAIPSAVSPVEVASSDQVLFHSDSIALRVIFRLGWAVMHPKRLGKVTVAKTTETTE